MISFQEYLTLIEATTPFGKRLEWVVKNERDPVTAFFVLDVMLFSQRSGSPYLGGLDSIPVARFREDPLRHRLAFRRALRTGVNFIKGERTLFNDIRTLAAPDEDDPNDHSRYDPSRRNLMTDDEVRARLKLMLLGWIESGKWYNVIIIPDRSPWEKLVGWVANWVRKRDEKQVSTLVKHGRNIADWFSVVRPNIMSLTPTQAQYRSGRWHTAMAREKEGKEEIASADEGKKVATLEGGVEIYTITPEDCRDEGSAMRTCIGKVRDYADNIRRGTAEAFSVRRNKKRLYTAFIEDSSLEQFKAKANLRPGMRGTDVDAAWQAIKWMEGRGIRTDSTYDLQILRPN